MRRKLLLTNLRLPHWLNGPLLLGMPSIHGQYWYNICMDDFINTRLSWSNIRPRSFIRVKWQYLKQYNQWFASSCLKYLTEQWSKIHRRIQVNDSYESVNDDNITKTACDKFMLSSLIKRPSFIGNAICPQSIWVYYLHGWFHQYLTHLTYYGVVQF